MNEVMTIAPKGMMSRRLCSLMLIAVLMFSIAACDGDSSRTILPPDIDLREGDIVLRRGLGITSRVVYSVDIDGYYSHLGMVVATDSGLMVVHSVPGEPAFDGDIDRVKLDRPQEFFLPERAEHGAVIRVDCDSRAIAKAKRYVLDAYQRHTPFDNNYDDSDTTELYCCELVVQAYRQGGVELTDTTRHTFSLPGLMSVECILPSDVYKSAKVREIAVF